MHSFSTKILGDISFEQLQKYVQAFFPEQTYKNPTERKAALREYLSDADLPPFCTHFSQELLRITGIEKAIPNIYEKFRPFITDGVRYLLENIDPQRLKEICIEQLLLPAESHSEERLFHLAVNLPTLYKLGQIVARNRNLDGKVKHWLECLESGFVTVDIPLILQILTLELDQFRPDYDIEPEESILSEASVGVVIGLSWRKKGNPDWHRGVAKLLKPGVRKHLLEEIALLASLGELLEQRKASYNLPEFPFRETIMDIVESLNQEIDFSQEQKHLNQAKKQFSTALSIDIPELLPFCTYRLTAMRRIEGEKITAVELVPGEKRQAAVELFLALICQTLFSNTDDPLFHGDLHAGNILYVRHDSGIAKTLGLVDWSQAGKLTRRERSLIAQASLGLLLQDSSRMVQAFTQLAMPFSTEPMETLEANISRLTTDWSTTPSFRENTLIRRVFSLCDFLITGGIKFGRDLLLFRKTVFSFLDVIDTIDPNFDADSQLFSYLAPLLSQELPVRTMQTLFPCIPLNPAHRTLVSNADLLQTSFHLGLTLWLQQILGTSLLLSRACQPAFLSPHP